MEWSELLRRYWGPDFQLRSQQQPIVESLCQERDVLALLPTGEGKSLCFQLAGLSLGGLVLVISPLLALIQEQVEQLRARGLRAWQLSSRLSSEQRRRLLQELEQFRQGFLYLAPEQLQGRSLRAFLAAAPPRLLVIDEAHCISQWGRSFRPAYRQLGSLLQVWHPRPVIGAFTATAPPSVQAEITAVLGLRAPLCFQGAVLRENIEIAVQHCWTPRGKRQALLRGIQGKTLIYVRSRQATEDLARLLGAEGKQALYFHAGCAPRQRQESYQHFRTCDQGVMVATTAFGMGIDIPDIQTVIHWHLPESLEAYVQEIGRGGRNRQFQARALALQLWGESIFSKRSSVLELAPRVWKLLGQGRSLIEIQDLLALSDPELNVLVLPWLAEGWLEPLPGKRYRPYQTQWQAAFSAPLQQALLSEQQFRHSQQLAFRHYLRSSRCRRQGLEAYFSVPEQPPCGVCDCCRKKQVKTNFHKD